VIVPVFKTGGRHLAMSPVGSTPTRFRQCCQLFSPPLIEGAICRSEGCNGVRDKNVIKTVGKYR